MEKVLEECTYRGFEDPSSFEFGFKMNGDEDEVTGDVGGF